MNVLNIKRGGNLNASKPDCTLVYMYEILNPTKSEVTPIKSI